uniref:Uncharacterized protein n=1 Tax=Lepeophtheirus salmonis TaxID=72036 RepID=A0A0K2VAP7_LEPSM
MIEMFIFTKELHPFFFFIHSKNVKQHTFRENL